MVTRQAEPGIDEREQQGRRRRRGWTRRAGVYALLAALAVLAAILMVRMLPGGTRDGTATTPSERRADGVALVDVDGTIVGTIGSKATGEGASLLAAGALNGLSVSPDGTEIVVSSGTSIHTMNLDGTDIAKLINGTNPAWSPDGSLIAFADWKGINVVAPDGSGLRTVVSAEVSQAAWPAWSPDGRRIAYMIQGRDNARHGIYVVDLDGGEPMRLTRQWDAFPSWGPGGTAITFTRIAETQDLYVVRLGGSTRATPLVAGDRGEAGGLWSPSGDLLAYWGFDEAFQTDFGKVDVHLLVTRTGEDRVILQGGAPIGWAPDGMLLVAR
jgi:Tol biopolymer transport system component